jgi:hypothetical protein
MPYHSKALGEPHPTIPNQTIDGDARERVQLAILSLWLAKPSCVGIAMIVQFAGDPRGGTRHIELSDGVIPHQNHERNVLSAEDIAVARDLLTSFSTVPRTSAVWTATKFLWISVPIPNTWWDGRYLMTWIALEALFGPESRRRVTERLRRRISCFLSQDRKQKEEMSDRVGELYDWRSKLAHGRSMSGISDNESLGASFDSEELLRNSLRKILLNAGLTNKFSTQERDGYLDGLACSR